MRAYLIRRSRPEAHFHTEDRVQSSLDLAAAAATVVRAALAALLFAAATAHAQTYTLDFFSIEGGGGTSTSGAYTVSSTVGQSDAAVRDGLPFSVSTGFWSVSAAVNSPFLIVTHAGGSVTVQWIKPATDFLLEESATLAPTPGTAWMQVPVENYQTNATHVFLTIPAAAASRFYHLRKP